MADGNATIGGPASPIKSGCFVEEAYKSYADAILRRLQRACVDRQLAEDLTQSVFLRFAAHRTPESIGNTKGYLYSIADAVFVDHLRARRKQERVQDAVHADLVVNAQHPISPEQETLNKERGDHLTSVIESLPKKRRLSLLHALFNPRSPDKIAAELGISKKTLRDHVYLALVDCEEEMRRFSEQGNETPNPSTRTKKKR